MEHKYFGADGQPLEVADLNNNRRCARFVYHYDADSQKTGSDCFDARGNPVAARAAAK
jgi:hypothetical protein